MADSESLHHKLKSGIYQIFSLTEGKPNVNVYVFNLQEESHYQPVRLDADNLEWKVEHIRNNVYSFGVGPYEFTGEREKEVVASNDSHYNGRHWFVHYKENHEAYLITTDFEGTTGWTSGERRKPITIGPIPATMSIPPQYSAQNLFRFERFGKPE